MNAADVVTVQHLVKRYGNSPVFVYQMALSLTVLAIFGAFAGSNAPLLRLYVLCGTVLALSIGLLLGIMLKTAGAAGGFYRAASAPTS